MHFMCEKKPHGTEPLHFHNKSKEVVVVVVCVYVCFMFFFFYFLKRFVLAIVLNNQYCRLYIYAMF